MDEFHKLAKSKTAKSKGSAAVPLLSSLSSRMPSDKTAYTKTLTCFFALFSDGIALLWVLFSKFAPFSRAFGSIFNPNNPFQPMKTNRLWLFLAALFVFTAVSAQRHTDALNRGLVAVPLNQNSNHVSWRQLPEEYYGTTYTLIRDGRTVATGLTKNSYVDKQGAAGSRYQVQAVVNGTAGNKSDRMKPWPSYVYTLNENSCHSGYLDIPLADVYDRDGVKVTTDYSPNDAEMADLNGDGDLEIIIKRLNTADATGFNTGNKDSEGHDIYNIYPASSRAFVVIDAYDVNWQTGAATLMWRIDCGPNMVSLNSTEIDIIAYDWDEDGCAEVVLRGADDMIIHKSDGTSQTIGIAGYNFRQSSHFNHLSGGQYAWTFFGREYLIYMDGKTGTTYQVMDFPLPRIEQSEWNGLGVSVPYNDYVALANAGYGNYFTKTSGTHHKAWGDDYGHRSSKYFFGAPVLDGRSASLFMARGIYTRHKMIAMNLDKKNHEWSELWTWKCNNSSSPWYGNGYHNFIIADVDEDGRDEIVYGSMVIDDDGHGLSTTGFEHGDAQHVTDFNPWRKGLEFFGCLEDGPYYGCDYRDATTSEVLYKFNASKDDGRALMANFSNVYPGSLGRSASSSIMSSVTNQLIDALSGDTYIVWSDLNNRIYWDGDLCSEILNSPGTARDAKVEKPGKGRLFTTVDCSMNNDSKNNPCFQGDILGDWREEIVVRCGTNLRVYTSGEETDYTLPTLWFDHQYRQAMVWQMMAYNQPPHLSYFLGELEGYTVAPPPLTLTGRTIVEGGATIGASANGQHIMACKASDMTISVEQGASPSVFTDNAPSWVQGTDVNGTSGTKVKNASQGVTNLPAINRTYYTHTLTGGGFSGNMALCKQGDGTLILPDVEQTYTGETTVWAGTLQFNSQLTNSPLALKRFTTLNTTGGSFPKGISMEYGATLNVGGAEQGTIGTVSTSALQLGYGARIALDINGKGDDQHDWLDATTISLDTDKASDDTWTTFGPEHLAPVLVLNITAALEPGLYPIGHVDNLSGDLTKVELTTPTGATASLEFVELVHEDGLLALKVSGMAELDEPQFAVTEMKPYGEHFLPVVRIVTDEPQGVNVSMQLTFTATDGTISTPTASGANHDEYTFTEPGTLTVTLASIGYASATATFDVTTPYDVTYQSLDYSTIAASQAHGILGNDWETETFTSRWANWNRNNATYGSNYVMVKNANNAYGQNIYLDNDGKLYASYIGSAYPLTLVQDFGIGQNKPATFHADQIGTKDTWIMVRTDVSFGNNISTTGFVRADAEGNFTYEMPMNGTLQQITVYTPGNNTPIDDIATGISHHTSPNTQHPTFSIYDLTGRYRGTSAALLPAGTYIVRSAGKSHKLMVR